MISYNPKHILFIEPAAPPSAEPVIDVYTRRMAAAARRMAEWDPTRGVHVCTCGVLSGSCSYINKRGVITHSLCVHYLAYHRADVPAVELEKVRALSEEVEPTALELAAPRRRRVVENDT